MECHLRLIAADIQTADKCRRSWFFVARLQGCIDNRWSSSVGLNFGNVPSKPMCGRLPCAALEILRSAVYNRIYPTLHECREPL
jgi:hypothetical protein